MENETVVITRHAPLVAYLVEIGLVPASARVIEHATENDVRGRNVIGVVPLRLAALAQSVTEVPLALTREDREAMSRGDLPVERIRAIAGAPVRYTVERARCGRCHQNAAEPPHPCPYQAELYPHDKATPCTCCDACEAECIADI